MYLTTEAFLITFFWQKYFIHVFDDKSLLGSLRNSRCLYLGDGKFDQKFGVTYNTICQSFLRSPRGLFIPTFKGYNMQAGRGTTQQNATGVYAEEHWHSWTPQFPTDIAPVFAYARQCQKVSSSFFPAAILISHSLNRIRN